MKKPISHTTIQDLYRAVELAETAGDPTVSAQPGTMRDLLATVEQLQVVVKDLHDACAEETEEDGITWVTWCKVCEMPGHELDCPVPATNPMQSPVIQVHQVMATTLI